MKLTGKIIHGAGRGHDIGFPTINIRIMNCDLEFGVYAVKVKIVEREYFGAMNWGSRPTFDESEPHMEIFLLDFHADVYEENADVEILKKIRDVKKFDSKGELIKQIALDVAFLRDLTSATTLNLVHSD